MVALKNGDLVSCSFDKTVRIWNTTNGTLKRSIDVNDYINSMVLVSETEVALGLSENNIQTWNVTTGEPKSNLALENAETGFNINALLLLPNGDLASASFDKTIKIWSLKTGCLRATLKGHEATVCALAVLDNLQLVSGSGDNSVRVWNYWMSVNMEGGRRGSNETRESFSF